MSRSATRTRTVSVELPDELVEGDVRDISDRLRLLWLIDEGRHERMSGGRAAALAQMSLVDFYDVLAEHGVPTIRMTEAEWAAELEVIGGLGGRHTSVCCFGRSRSA